MLPARSAGAHFRSLSWTALAIPPQLQPSRFTISFKITVGNATRKLAPQSPVSAIRGKSFSSVRLSFSFQASKQQRRRRHLDKFPRMGFFLGRYVTPRLHKYMHVCARAPISINNIYIYIFNRMYKLPSLLLLAISAIPRFPNSWLQSLKQRWKQ